MNGLSFTLAGLSDKYQPIIMALKNSGIKITADAIKTKLLQDIDKYDKALPSASTIHQALSITGKHKKFNNC